MGVSTDRVAFVVIFLAAIVAGLSRMPWIHVQNLNGVLSIFSVGEFSVHGPDLRNVTQSDGNAVAIMAGACVVSAFVSFAGAPLRRPFGAGVALAGAATSIIAIVNVYDAINGQTDFNSSSHASHFTMAWPLMMTVIFSVIISVMGAVIALEPDDETPIENGLSQDGALQW